MTKSLICRCEDIPVVEVEEALEEGYTDLESLRRFTALGTGPCQGKACITECIRLLAAHHDVPEDAVGLHTMRPPLVPVPLGHLAELDDETLDGLLDGPGLGTGRTEPRDPKKEDADRADAVDRPVRGVVTEATFREWEGGA